MAKEELMTLEGHINEILPDGRFGVTLDNEHKIIAYTAGKMRRFRIRSVVGDRVHVEMTPLRPVEGADHLPRADSRTARRRAEARPVPALTCAVSRTTRTRTSSAGGTR